jgi:hypothetical protein
MDTELVLRNQSINNCTSASIEASFLANNNTFLGSNAAYLSQLLRGLRRGSAAARLLGLWVRIPLGAWMSLVSGVCFQVEVSVSG